MECETEEKDEDHMLSSSIVEPEDVDDNEKIIMKGDTVGDTAYSAQWILKTLISLSKFPEEVEWSNEMEEELCFLWDMTAEKDIVSFLLENQFLSIVEYVLNVSTEERLTEIIVGIVGNLCCHADILYQIAERTELIQSLMNLLHCNDTETLIQVLRILQTVVHNFQSKNPCSKWLNHLKQCNFLGNALTFILKSSTNENLLTAVLNVLQSVSSSNASINNLQLQEIFDIKLLLSALVETFSQLIPTKSNDDVHTSKQMKIIESWLEILSKILQISSPNVHDNIENDEEVTNVLIQIIEPYKIPENLKMTALEEPTTIDIIYQTIELIHWFQKSGFNVDIKAIAIILEIMHQLSIVTSGSYNETEENHRVKDLQQYLENYWLMLLSCGSIEDINDILKQCSEATKYYLVNYAMQNAPKESVNKIA